MTIVVLTSVSGWVLIVLLIATILYPFLLRKGWLGPAKPFLRRMRLHAFLGYSIAIIVFVHAWVPMSAGLARGLDALGLDLATIAWLLVFLQVGLGWWLNQPRLRSRRLLRRWHFWVMTSVVLLFAGHIMLNSFTLQMLALH